jgi:endonuclease YncB( thermonuclease family)
MREYCYFYTAYISKVIDGDSCVGDIDLGFGIKTSKTKIRLDGIDTAEMKSKDSILKEKAMEAKELLKSLIENKTVYLKSLGVDKYGRSLAIIYTMEGKCCNEELKDKNLALNYDGGTKKQELLKN